MHAGNYYSADFSSFLQAHPRLSMLVGTCLQAMDDLWHFFLLMVIVFGGFMFMGVSLFAAEKLEFQARNAFLAFLDILGPDISGKKGISCHVRYLDILEPEVRYFRTKKEG